MRTASFKVSKTLLMELIGFRNLDGFVYFDEEDANTVTISVIGDDERIPEGFNYTEYRAVCERLENGDIESRFENIDEAVNGK